MKSPVLRSNRLIINKTGEREKQRNQTQGVNQKDTAHQNESSLIVQPVGFGWSLPLQTIC